MILDQGRGEGGAPRKAWDGGDIVRKDVLLGKYYRVNTSVDIHNDTTANRLNTWLYIVPVSRVSILRITKLGDWTVSF